MTSLPFSGETATRNYSKRAVPSTEKEANMVERAESSGPVRTYCPRCRQLWNAPWGHAGQVRAWGEKHGRSEGSGPQSG